jgi:hypothetical protein
MIPVAVFSSVINVTFDNKKQPCWPDLLKRIDHELYRTNTGEQIRTLGYQAAISSRFLVAPWRGIATARAQGPRWTIGVLGSAA